MLTIHADVLIPGKGDPIENGTVVTDGGVITYAGPTAGAPSSEDAATVTEVPVLMPGLWDCHAHLFGSPSWSLEGVAWVAPAAAGARATADLARYLQGGVTSVREVGGYGVELAAVVAEGSVSGPSI